MPLLLCPRYVYSCRVRRAKVQLRSMYCKTGSVMEELPGATWCWALWASSWPRAPIREAGGRDMGGVGLVMVMDSFVVVVWWGGELREEAC